MIASALNCIFFIDMHWYNFSLCSLSTSPLLIGKNPCHTHVIKQSKHILFHLKVGRLPFNAFMFLRLHPLGGVLEIYYIIAGDFLVLEYFWQVISCGKSSTVWRMDAFSASLVVGRVLRSKNHFFSCHHILKHFLACYHILKTRVNQQISSWFSWSATPNYPRLTSFVSGASWLLTSVIFLCSTET